MIQLHPRRWLVAGGVFLVMLFGYGSMTLAEVGTTIPLERRMIPRSSEGEEVTVRSADGLELRGWLFAPVGTANGQTAIVLHGVGDTRLGSLGYARMLTRHGYRVVTPDARGHGASEGDRLTYGIRERDDVRRWAQAFGARYGLGSSMGAGVLLQSIGEGSPFRAVVAISPFDSFRRIARDRIRNEIGWWPLPMVEGGLWYLRWRYGIDYAQASPAAVLARSGVPVLLIHGSVDRNIPVEHSRRLHAVRPSAVYWEVAGAGHVNVPAVAGAEFERRVVEWFGRYQR